MKTLTSEERWEAFSDWSGGRCPHARSRTRGGIGVCGTHWRALRVRHHAEVVHPRAMNHGRIVGSGLAARNAHAAEQERNYRVELAYDEAVARLRERIIAAREARHARGIA